MRYLVVAILSVALFAAGYLAATVGQSDADAQGTWQVEYFAFTDAKQDIWDVRGNAESFIESLAADCVVDLEFTGDLPAVAYSCPD